jgi:hypothetical protein
MDGITLGVTVYILHNILPLVDGNLLVGKRPFTGTPGFHGNINDYNEVIYVSNVNIIFSSISLFLKLVSMI